jgi:hypothetical protein
LLKTGKSLNLLSLLGNKMSFNNKSGQLKFIFLAALILTISLPAFFSGQVRKNPSTAKTSQEGMPDWKRRGIPGAGHAALKPLIGTWRVQMSFYATFGRSPEAPPIVADGLICTRTWVAGGRYIEDLTQGTIGGTEKYWRKGWLGYSIMDQRYEWVTIDMVNTTMMAYVGKPGSGGQMPIDMSGIFTDQGVAGEQSVGKPVGMRTVIKIENNDRHIFELYFTPPGKPEVLASRAIYTRISKA